MECRLLSGYILFACTLLIQWSGVSTVLPIRLVDLPDKHYKIPVLPANLLQVMDYLDNINTRAVSWRNIKQECLHLEYAVVIPKTVGDQILIDLEEQVEYFKDELAMVKVFGKKYPLPRQHVAFGDSGVKYTYSGVTVPALPWIPPVERLRDLLATLKGIKYNFVLVNKYRNGKDHIGEHRDNEPELDSNCPIASITLGQERTFVLKHKDARKSGKDKRPIAPVKIELEHGSILFMNPPTNDVWYHSLPARKGRDGIRINLTFRMIKLK